MISKAITPTLLRLLEDNRKLIADFVVHRKRFEPWLQEALFERLRTQNTKREAERERPYPDSQERCDIWLSESGRESWLELKCCTTNYLHRFTESSTSQNITNEIDDIIRDGNKLRRLPRKFNRRIVFLAYPLPAEHSEYAAWVAHIQRIRNSKIRIEGYQEMQMKRNGKSALIVIYDCKV